MKPYSESPDILKNTLDLALKEALTSIAPQWSLTQQIAVNPFWHKVNTPFKQWAAEFTACTGQSLLDTPSIPLAPSVLNNEELKKQAQHYTFLHGDNLQWNDHEATQPLQPKKSLFQIVDEKQPLNGQLHHAIRYQISQTTAAFADKQQSQWRDDTPQGLYAFWRNHLEKRWNLEFAGFNQLISQRIKLLPFDSQGAIPFIVNELSVNSLHWKKWFQQALFSFPGWASWCAYQDQYGEGALKGSFLSDLLAIILSWEFLIDDTSRTEDSAWFDWQAQWCDDQSTAQQDHLNYLYSALWLKEYQYQQTLIKVLQPAPTALNNTDVCHTQMVFCIDVRSEPMRQTLESLDPGIETRGFAGFFGIPVTYKQPGQETHYFHGLLKPVGLVKDTSSDPQTGILAKIKKQVSHAVQCYQEQIKSHPLSSLLWVEGMGFTYLFSLVANLFKRPTVQLPHHYQEVSKGINQLTLTMSEESKISAIKAFLKGTDLNNKLAKRVIIVGHGAQTVNNPHQHSLDCGACGGQSGALNALLMVQLLNDYTLRQRLAEEGYALPQDTRFIAAHHNTTAQCIELLHVSEDKSLEPLLSVFNQATEQLLDPQLSLTHASKRQKTHNWAQVRPEWGLINNAALIVAKRSKTRHCQLQGRIFLHEYNADEDADLTQLEQILLAPMIVAHWINMSYFTSRTLPDLFGSGNKLLHNVVGGDIGVFEGNSGDLRIGLAQQSLHDGKEWLHEAQRLTVIIDASESAIETVINKHPLLQSLVDGHWLHVLSWQNDEFRQYAHGQWITC
ncbi:DUF2309 domain-containing protein [Ferrovum sp. PN-J185]|uniref:putative inorganic carbon transporter subunit DabA n=1 Tax=Ferrovum sp. PN-J185 TaxID=1356306 RepID=UPI0007997F86|nr:putative inorganic carbon transporter subunit DabA [Ferrovum sp. PN-J185]KXW56595.1 hypothetical protein FV185_05500 [Ferrovum sp. PN-J185]MCC6068356.1 DUF2309 domain-containing protein [Ferrovum sp. PN-J185]